MLDRDLVITSEIERALAVDFTGSRLKFVISRIRLASVLRALSSGGGYHRHLTRNLQVSLSLSSKRLFLFVLPVSSMTARTYTMPLQNLSIWGSRTW